MYLNTENFEKKLFGKKAKLFTYTAKSGACLVLTNYGARIVDIIVKDKNDEPVSVVSGYEKLKDYYDDTIKTGAICGRYAGRIHNASFDIDGIHYELDKNHGQNTLHGGSKSLSEKIWDYRCEGEHSIVFSTVSEDMEMGFPGKVRFEIRYTFSCKRDHSQVIIDYYATTDKKTHINLTNHSYFCLDGEFANLEDHYLKINASRFLEVDKDMIPTGKMIDVKDTAFDFTSPRPILDKIDSDDIQLEYADGYDHTFVLDSTNALEMYSTKTGIDLKIDTTMPGMHVYTGNFIGSIAGRKHYTNRSCVALETQFFPDSPNRPEFPSTLLEPDEVFSHTTKYTFTTK